MIATIDLPDPVFEALRSRAAQQDSSVEALILQVIQNAIEPALSINSQKRVQLPLVPSKRPGTLRSLTSGEIDDILG